MLDHSPLSRREALKTGVALAAGAPLWWSAAPAPARLGSPQVSVAAPPALAMIALNRLAFGPRPGQFDFDFFFYVSGRNVS